MSNFYKDTMNVPIVGAEYGFNGVVDPEYARGHRDALIAASKIALDADAKIDGLKTELAEARAEVESYQAKLAEEQERNLNNVANAQMQIEEITADREVWRAACLRARESVVRGIDGN